jgi:hypothetical protein
MTDQELLEYAAKAVGLEDATFVEESSWGWGITHKYDEYDLWNPLAKNRHAFGLMVDLNLTEKHSFLDKLHEENATWAPDYRKAHRRAIVRAAAEIGRDMTDG